MTVFGVEAEVFSAYVGLISLIVAIIGLGGVFYQLTQAKDGILETRTAAQATRQAAEATRDQLDATKKQLDATKEQLDATKKQVDAIEGLLDHSEKTSLLSAVLQTDSLLVNYAQQRQWVNDNHKLPPNQQKKPPDMVPYMAVFERLAVAMKMGLIGPEYVYRFYSSRFRRLLRTESVRDLMVTQPHGWQHLIGLAIDLDDWVEGNKARKLRPVVVGQAPPPSERFADPDVTFLKRLRELRESEPDVSTDV